MFRLDLFYLLFFKFRHYTTRFIDLGSHGFNFVLYRTYAVLIRNLDTALTLVRVRTRFMITLFTLRASLGRSDLCFDFRFGYFYFIALFLALIKELAITFLLLYRDFYSLFQILVVFYFAFPWRFLLLY